MKFTFFGDYSNMSSSTWSIMSSGGTIYWFYSFFQSKLLKNSCFFILPKSPTPNRFFMLRSRSPLIKLRLTFETYDGYFIFAFFMFSNSWSMLSSKNGGSPTNISYRTHPIPYMSVYSPTPFFSSISGDRYAGLPQKDIENVFSLLNPKSVSLM